ncbi:MAG: NADH-quinone oxidoreductase subunit L [Deltaproteobacteria bacterium]|nr:NADH-quinone oxidoreductase subunit L [Deltaproteobacteria bacterium]MBW2051404.1 NADH-quinone oxidoreductase subunit L [Deltaproteobacteria bacterium]MBW2140040.1 NADH-quinone oxidoreductase subunit L [Deltaproteobacteria bacterium]MBW2321919.1 NADH-quinone oxidoreductase subunit L [Deltaproteobacteria bacterium]
MLDGLSFELLMAIVASMAPVLCFGLIMVFTRRSISASVTVGIIGSFLSWFASLYLFLHYFHAEEAVVFKGAWVVSASLKIPFGYYFDPHSLLMLMIVATISLVIQIYSIGYMAGDPGKSRYYAFLCLFSWSMINLVIAPGLLQLYIFWELVGVSSYLLIGFYFEKWSASEAGKKAFVMTRAGDIGFFIGIIILMLTTGHLSIAVFGNAAEVGNTGLSQALLTLSAILIFSGAVGKSAQFPLLTWLPDAMEGPTPVSALLHSATMVAAGVYLVSRIFPFYAASSTAMMVVLIIGTITMLLSSTMAMTARDIKQVWAFSTISQLGFMFMGLGAGAYFAGVFHLTTHAFFKALLFLCAGVFIHHFETNDFFEMSKAGARKMLIPMITVTIGVAALSGIPPFSGFFSKEAIMAGLAHKGNIWLIAGLLGAAMTAYYSFRVIFVMWFPKGEVEEHGHGHEGGHDDGHGGGRWAWVTEWSMLSVLLILGAITLVLGFFQKELEHFLTGHSAEHHGSQLILVLALGCALAGVILAWFEFGAKNAKQEGFLSRMKSVEALFSNRWYMDHAYRKLLDYVVYGGITNTFTRNDRVIIDGGIDGLCRFTVSLGRAVSRIQSGLLQYNLYLTFLVVALMGLYFLLV